MKRLVAISLFMFIVLCIRSQQYMGTSGLFHVPSADMDSSGVVKFGIYFIPKDIMPDHMTTLNEKDGEKFNSASYYLAISPFEWVELAVKGVLWRTHKNRNPELPVRYYGKDRHLSLRLRPLKEGKYWPSVVIGGDDIWGSDDEGITHSGYFCNYYIATTKHFVFKGNMIGTHLTYRRWKQDYFQKFNGLTSGLTFQPTFYHPLRLVVEWTGNEVNAGADCRIPLPFAGSGTGLLLQAGLHGGRDFFGGICLAIDLNGRP